MGLHRRGAAAAPGGDPRAQLRRGALGLREHPAGGGTARRGDRGDPPGPDAGSPRPGLRALARALPALRGRPHGGHRPGREDHRAGRGLLPGLPGHRLGPPGPG